MQWVEMQHAFNSKITPRADLSARNCYYLTAVGCCILPGGGCRQQRGALVSVTVTADL